MGAATKRVGNLFVLAFVHYLEGKQGRNGSNLLILPLPRYYYDVRWPTDHPVNTPFFKAVCESSLDHCLSVCRFVVRYFHLQIRVQRNHINSAERNRKRINGRCHEDDGNVGDVFSNSDTPPSNDVRGPPEQVMIKY